MSLRVLKGESFVGPGSRDKVAGRDRREVPGEPWARCLGCFSTSTRGRNTTLSVRNYLGETILYAFFFTLLLLWPQSPGPPLAGGAFYTRPHTEMSKQSKRNFHTEQKNAKLKFTSFSIFSKCKQALTSCNLNLTNTRWEFRKTFKKMLLKHQKGCFKLCVRHYHFFCQRGRRPFSGLMCTWEDAPKGRGFPCDRKLVLRESHLQFELFWLRE